MVHVRTSRHQDVKERIQHELGTVAHPKFWYAGDWLELRTSQSRWHVCCTPQITKRKIQVGVSTRHKYWVGPTQNRKQYISNNNINNEEAPKLINEIN